MNLVRHPAKFSDVLLPIFEDVSNKYFPDGKILDPFAGTGEKIKKLFGDRVVTLEIEPEWAFMQNDVQGDATQLPFRNENFQAILTSITYGNRMADCHNARDSSRRNTYTHVIGHNLHDNNTGKMNWGKKYRDMHALAWKECCRVLKPSGYIVLNISNHIRKGKEIDVSGWHRDLIVSWGLTLQEEILVPTPRLRYGANSNLRVDNEKVIIFQKETQ